MTDTTSPTPGGHDTLLQHLNQQQAAVRDHPTDPARRWALIETLCLLCQWERALQQLQTWVRLQPDAAAQAHALRGLIQAEAQRMQVFAGHAPPAPVIEFTPWMQALWQALQHNSRGEHAQADALRESALSSAPTQAGRCRWQARPDRAAKDEQAPLQTQDFAWLADSDTRLGPVCEIMASGGYRWLPFADIASLTFSAPQRRLDLIWRPAQVTLRGSANSEGAGSKAPVLHAFIPVRSCWLHAPALPDTQQQALLQARLTVWHEQGQTGVFSTGQKTWMSDGIDWPVLDVRELQMASQNGPDRS